MNYYIGDMRYSCFVNSKYEHRPFANTEIMNEEMSKRWNSTVHPEDTVYILGNVCMGYSSEWAERLGSLMGRKVLVMGEVDHIQMRNKTYHMFDNIITMGQIYDEGREIILCHYPIIPYHRNFNPHTYMLFSQSKDNDDKMQTYKMIRRIRRQFKEGKTENRGQLINVAASMPYMNFKPRSLRFLMRELHSGDMYSEEPDPPMKKGEDDGEDTDEFTGHKYGNPNYA